MSVMIMAADGSRRAAAGLGHRIGGMVAAVKREYCIRHEIRSLLERGDYLLRDIGLSRSDVERLVRGDAR